MLIFGNPIRLTLAIQPERTQSSERERQRVEAQRNIRRRHDWLLNWVERFPLASAIPIPAAMDWRYQQEARMRWPLASFRSDYQVAGSVSGRFSSVTPNRSNPPRHIQEVAR